MHQFPVPPAKLGQDDLENIGRVAEALETGVFPGDRNDLDAWVDKTIRLIEFNRRGLKKLFATRFGQTGAHPAILTLLIRRAWPTQELLASDLVAKPDMRSLNAALWIDDAGSSLPPSPAFTRARSELSALLGRLPGFLDDRGADDWCEDFVSAPVFADVASDPQTSANAEPVVVFSPNRRSRNSVATLHQMAELGVHVSDIFVRRIGSISRLVEELRFSPRFLLKRVFNELPLPKKRSPTNDVADLTAYMQRSGCHARSIEEIAERFPAVRVRYFTNFNDSDCAAALKELNPGYGVFTGGGILKHETLSQFQHGIIHAHPGILPQYKGMDVVQWAVLEGRYDAIGSTCQVMSPALDAGVLLSNDPIDAAKSQTLNHIRTSVVERKIDLLSGTVSEVVSGRIDPTEHPAGGRQYMLMNPRLVEMVSYILENGLHQ